MPSFFEKLKKGMDIKKVSTVVEEDISEEEEMPKPIEEEEAEETEEADLSEEQEEAESDKEEEPDEPVDQAEEPEEEASEDEETPLRIDNPLPPKELSPKELEEKIGDDNEDGPKPAGLKNFLAQTIIEEDDEPRRRPQAKKKPAVSKKTFRVRPEPEKESRKNTPEVSKKGWFEAEGQLVVDVYESDGYIFIKSAIAGIKPDELEISIEGDTVLIRGERRSNEEDRGKNYFYKECYWGSFSREIILPTEVDGGKSEASMKNGILTIKIPKIEREKRKISIR